MNKPVKITAMLMLVAMAGCLMSGCRKQCACIHNNGTIIYYNKSEVEDINGGSCSGMKYQSGVEYYVACDWE
ncbi:MAG: hypothetical protein AUK63_365 [bacterium P3]|nr:MAG: hypothetical protein AUK63_365 [bacterium P3]KWW42675.1 MAG: hypothetical protein F083_79 [bacterium F083]